MKLQALKEFEADFAEFQPLDTNEEAQLAIEAALEVTDGDWAEALDVIIESDLVGETAKSIAAETLSQEQPA